MSIFDTQVFHFRGGTSNKAGESKRGQQQQAFPDLRTTEAALRPPHHIIQTSIIRRIG